MKHVSHFIFFFYTGAILTTQAQKVVADTNYYALPPTVRQSTLNDDPNDNANSRETRIKRQNRPAFLEQLSEAQTWHIGVEGGFRSDISRLSNSFTGLVRNATQTKAVWSVMLGYTYRNAWSVEAGYIHAPTHLNITIVSSPEPLVFTYSNNGYGIPIRLKRRLGSGKQSANGTGFWITGGAWLTPSRTSQSGEFKLVGYSYGNRSRVDTIRLASTTNVFNSITGLAELGLDYSTRLSTSFELGGYVRKYWGFSNALQSDLIYTLNNRSTQQATITADGSGWGFGLFLRYIYGRQHELKKNTNDKSSLNR